MSKKRVLLLGINFSPELTGIGKYTGEMAEWLAGSGFDCTVVTSFPYYPQWKMQKPYTGKWYKKEVSADGNLCVYRCPLYVPASPTGIKRILHELTFCFTAFFVLLRLFFKPSNDIVFCMAPPFLLGFLGLFYRFFKGGKLVYHIHDMQIEAARDLNILKSDALFRFLFRIEKYILNSSDYVTTVAVGMKKKIELKTRHNVIHFANWVAIENFWPLTNDTSAKQHWGFKETDKIALYSGAIGEKQGLESLITVAENLKNEHHIKIAICGTGPYKERLMQMTEEKNLDNIVFLPLQEMDVFNRFLNMADVHLIIQKRKAGDLMMPSKLTNVHAVGGLALITADPGTNLHEVVTEHNIGVLIPAEDDKALQDAIVRCCADDFTPQKRNGRIYVERHLARTSILKALLATVSGDSVNADANPSMVKPVLS
ncbi:WcaI family glycosyltransferase [Mucilaginibacter sp. 21P]|uniref:WcaI family glycosyltransferase n=1 Tax=Mucilaginibacter sp. 21P TaxID=2778902 RepID=UPI001C55DFFB|nr:WcaI family glycosyltransferase [Mucilaginibacter sp. 21P]QXV64866.1 WcaI family glycosyltransferase [Mucilaginibacter sp. 21P]